MKKIEAVIRREKFEAVDAALKKIGVGGLTLEEVKGRGRTRVVTTIHMRGVWTQEDEYIRHIKLEIIAKDDKVDQVVESIMSTASTGHPGDGKIFVSAVDMFVDIGSRLSGEKAVEIEANPPVKERPSQDRPE
jgi:nitrogen regulatory protein P-II 1